MVITSLPPGFRFHPTDVELVKYYLERKVLGKGFPIEAIAEVDIYKFAPWDLRGKAYLSRDLKWYFFCPHERKYAAGARINRSTDYGSWNKTGNDKPIIYKGRRVGMIKRFVFHRRGGESKKERTDWMMHEYRLEDEDLKRKGVAQDAFVLCMIFQKPGRGPSNGAQYGAPYNEEEWDDDGEADVPSSSGFIQAFLPDKEKQSVDIRITDSERYCGGSTSKACPAGPSQVEPSVVNVPPPAVPNDVTMEDPKDPCAGDLLSNGMFGDEIPEASSENDRVGILDHIIPEGNHKDEITMDDVFDGLEDLGDPLAPSRLPPSEPFMELNDFDAPLTSVNGPGPSGHNHSEMCFSAFGHSIAALQTLVIPEDENAPGLGLTDLEIPLTYSSEATQSNQAYDDASFSDFGGNDGLGGFGTISNPPVFTQPFHGSEVTHVPEGQCPQLEAVKGYVGMHQEVYGVEECTNQESVRYGVGVATSPVNNLDLGCAHACENSGRGRPPLW